MGERSVLCLMIGECEECLEEEYCSFFMGGGERSYDIERSR